MAKIQDDYVIIDSADRDTRAYPNPADYAIDLISPLKNIDTIELMSMQMTRTEPSCTSENCFFDIIANGVTSRVSLNVGNYSTTDFSSIVTSLGSLLPGGFEAYVDQSQNGLSRLIIVNGATSFQIKVTEAAARFFGFVAPGRDRGSWLDFIYCWFCCSIRKWCSSDCSSWKLYCRKQTHEL